MSAPDTNIERQESRHKPALLGIKGAMIFGALMIALMLFFMFDTDADGVESEGQAANTVVTD